MNAVMVSLNELRRRFAVQRMSRTRRAMAGTVLVLSLLILTGAVGQEHTTVLPGLLEAEGLMKDGKYEEARKALLDFQYRIYEARKAGEVNEEQAQELQRRAYALIERAEIALGCTVLRLEQEPPAARGTEVEPNAGGLAMVLEFLNIKADYDTLMGDSGLAFVWQAEALHKKGGKVEKFLKANWPFSFVTRVDFLSQTLGRRLKLEYLPDYACGAASLREFNYERVRRPSGSKSRWAGPFSGWIAVPWSSQDTNASPMGYWIASSCIGPVPARTVCPSSRNTWWVSSP